MGMNTYDPEDREYFAKRLLKRAKQSGWDSRKSNLVKKTNDECLVCSQYILFGQDLEIIHILPKRQVGL